jgi:hypothetical protein
MAATITPESAHKENRFPDLETIVGRKTWLTPSANEDAAGTPDGKMQWMLTQAVKSGCSSRADYLLKKKTLPTPRAFMHKDSKTDRGKSNLGEVVGGQLNPTWVEWLMGWPLGWTDLKPLAMDKFQQWRCLHGKS